MPNSQPERRCPRCGNALPSAASGGVCPRCALAGALESAGDDHGAQFLSLHDIPPPGQKVAYIGDYELLKVIAHGGMGVVYQARQVSLNRVVALKMLLGGVHASEEYKVRFRLEAETTAKLRHPNIVPIYEVGEHAAQPYFSMEYVAGTDLARLSRATPLPPERAARYLQTVADAVHYAHGQGVLHRDLKPSNILLDEHDHPRVADFGLARQVDAGSDLTKSGDTLGTPGYLPPEQASAKRGAVGPRSDVYSLGAVLYHLLTGRPPFQAATLLDTLQQVLEAEPVSPRLLNPAVPKDLSTICLNCLEKEPARRYASAKELSEELGRFLRGEPVHARPGTRLERGIKWAKRNPKLAAMGAVVAVVALVGAGAVAWEWNLRQVARAQAHAFDLSSQLQSVERAIGTGNSPGGLQTLAARLRAFPDETQAGQRLLSLLSGRHFPLLLGEPMMHTTSVTTGAVTIASFSPDGRRVLTASPEGSARIWEAGTGKLLHILSGHTQEVTAAEFSPDGRWIATAGVDNFARLWNSQSAQLTAAPLAHPGGVSSLHFSPDSKWLVTGSSDTVVRVWRVPEGMLFSSSTGHTAAVNRVRFDPGSTNIVSASQDGTARIWDANSRKLVGPPLLHPGPVGFAEFSPDGRWVLAGCSSNVFVWDRYTRRLLTKTIEHPWPIVHAEFSFDSQRIVTATTDPSTTGLGAEVRIWDARTGTPLTSPMPHPNGLWTAHFSPEGLRVITATEGGEARIWDARTGRPLSEPMRHHWLLYDARFSEDGLRAVTASIDGSARQWDVVPGEAHPRTLPKAGQISDAAFDPVRPRIALAAGGKVEFLDRTTGEVIPSPVSIPAERIWFSPDGKRLAAASSNETALRLWDTETGTPIGPPLVFSERIQPSPFSPDGRRLAVPSGTNGVLIWDGTNAPVRLAQPLAARAAWSPDGRLIVSASSQGNMDEMFVLRVWDVASARQTNKLEGHLGTAFDLAFDPFGRRVAAATADGSGWLWEVASARLLARLRHRSAATGVQFSPDGRRLLTASMDGTARLWDPETGAEAAEPLQHQAWVQQARFSADGRWVLTASHDGTARVWNARSGLPVSEPLRHHSPLGRAALSPDGRCVLTLPRGPSAYLWTLPVLLDATRIPLLVEAAEALNALQLNAGGVYEESYADLFANLRRRITSAPTDSFEARWTKWFLADRATREIAFGASWKQPQWFQLLLEDGSVSALEEAVRFSPTNGLALARLAHVISEQKDNPRRWGEADFFSRRALRYSPVDGEVLRVRQEIEQWLAREPQLQENSKP